MKVRMIVVTPTAELFNELMVPYYLASCFSIAADATHGEGVKTLTTRFNPLHEFAVYGLGGYYCVIEGDVDVGYAIKKHGDIQVVFLAQDDHLPAVDAQDMITKHILTSARPNSEILKETLHLPMGVDDFRLEMWGRSLLVKDYAENLSLEQWLHG